MPYIDPKYRKIAETQAMSSGELNYAITKLIASYLERNGLNYSKINDVLGALTGAQLEFYRRIVVPYENAKMAENGDVYGEKEKEEKLLTANPEE